MDDEQPINIEKVQTEVRASFERARELLCEAKLAMHQQRTSPEAPGPKNSARIGISGEF
jgi:hypothetical protein